jgi:uncharacterized protein YrrD
MDIAIGEPVFGRSGELGKVRRIVMDRHLDHIEAIVVKEGGLLGKDRLIEFHRVSATGNGQLTVDLDEDSFAELPEHAETPPLARNPDYVGPPSHDLHGDFQGNLAFDRAVAFGAGGYESGGKPMGYPGGETLAADSQIPATVAEGTPVIDCNGDKVGEIGAFSVDGESGRPVHAVLQQGMLFKRDTQLQIGWLQRLSPDGLHLSVTKDELEAQAEAA